MINQENDVNSNAHLHLGQLHYGGDPWVPQGTWLRDAPILATYLRQVSQIFQSLSD